MYMYMYMAHRQHRPAGAVLAHPAIVIDVPLMEESARVGALDLHPVEEIVEDGQLALVVPACVHAYVYVSIQSKRLSKTDSSLL